MNVSTVSQVCLFSDLSVAGRADLDWGEVVSRAVMSLRAACGRLGRCLRLNQTVLCKIMWGMQRMMRGLLVFGTPRSSCFTYMMFSRAR